MITKGYVIVWNGCFFAEHGSVEFRTTAREYAQIFKTEAAAKARLARLAKTWNCGNARIVELL
jgi:hypothetical protein